MFSDSRRERAAELRPQLREAMGERSLRSVADEMGITHPTLSSFLNGKTPSKRTLEKIESWLKTGLRNGKLTMASELGDPTGSPAERLIHLLTHPEIVRRFSDHPPMDFVKAAFAYALEEDFSSEEMEKLEAWRRAVRTEGDAGNAD